METYISSTSSFVSPAILEWMENILRSRYSRSSFWSSGCGRYWLIFGLFGIQQAQHTKDISKVVSALLSEGVIWLEEAWLVGGRSKWSNFEVELMGSKSNCCGRIAGPPSWLNLILHLHLIWVNGAEEIDTWVRYLMINLMACSGVGEFVLIFPIFDFKQKFGSVLHSFLRKRFFVVQPFVFIFVLFVIISKWLTEREQVRESYLEVTKERKSHVSKFRFCLRLPIANPFRCVVRVFF